MTLGQSHTLFFSLVSPSVQNGADPSLLQEQRATMESARGYNGDHPSSEGSARLSLSHSSLECSRTSGHEPSDPATPEDPEGPRRNQERKKSNDKSQFGNIRLQPGSPLSALEISLHRRTSLHPRKPYLLSQYIKYIKSAIRT